MIMIFQYGQLPSGLELWISVRSKKFLVLLHFLQVLNLLRFCVIMCIHLYKPWFVIKGDGSLNPQGMIIPTFFR